MATTSGSALRQALSENAGDFISVDTTADGNSDGLTIVSDSFLNQDNGGDTGAFERWYALIADSDSSADGESRRIADYVVDPDAPTVRVEVAFSVQIVSGITVELHRYNPVDKRNVINQSIQELYPDLYLPVRDESLIVDNLLSNSDFETFSSGFTGWTVVGSPTVTQETTIVMHGDSSAKVVASGAAGQLTQAPTINIDEITNETAEAERWCYATEANTVRIRLDFDGSNFANSPYHSGKDQWERLEVEATVPTNATQVKAICEVADGGTGYFDLGWLSLGAIFKYTLPTSIITGPYKIIQQHDEDDVDGPFYQIIDGHVPIEGRLLRVEGKGVLSQPSTDSATTEVGEPQVRLIVAYAEMLLWRLLASPARSAGRDRQGYVDTAKEAADKVAVLKAQKGMKTPPMGAQRHRDSWHMETDSSGRFIVFSQPRM